MEKGSSSSSPSSPPREAAGSLDGLKFGKKIYFEGSSSGLPPKSGGSSSPAKRGRTGLVHGGQLPRCQVEGCQVDLSGDKPYNSRHKVCEVHSKSPEVTVAGLKQRFCQQCSRFHQLGEFDQGKRSCRRRLAGHNERRRKPHTSSSFSSSVYGNPTLSKSGSPMMDFSAYPWLGGSQSHNAANSSLLQSSPQNPLSELLQSSASQHLDLSISAVPSEEFLGEASGALSLLSSQPWGSRMRSLGHWESNFLSSNLTQPRPDAPPVFAQFSCPPWSFKDANNSHEMLPELGLGQPPHGAGSSYSGELALAQPSDEEFPELAPSRAFNTSVNHTHWRL